MSVISDEVWGQWEKRAGAIVLVTVNAAGVPNAIYATCVKRHGEDTVLVADNYFNKTRANLKGGSGFSLLFITDDNAAYQFKGTTDYQTDGECHAIMRDCVDPKHPVHAVAVLSVREVYKGGERLA